MSVENKIKELLAKQGIKKLDEETGNPMPPTMGKDTTIVAANQGDLVPPMQGSSAPAGYEQRDEDEENQGAIAAKSVDPKASAASIGQRGPGMAPNYMDVADPTAVVSQPNGNAGNVPQDFQDRMRQESKEIRKQLVSILGEDLSEEFKNKAGSLFEAAVIARVNKEVVSITEAIEKKAAKELKEQKETMVSAVDQFMNYIAEQWLADNTLAVDKGLRSEITEQFIGGLRNLFKENYIDVPEDKYDLIEELQTKTEMMEAKLNESLKENVKLNAQMTKLKQEQIFESATADLTMVDRENLRTLTEGIEFESADLYKRKVEMIKENHFPTASKVASKQYLTEEVDGSYNPQTTDVMSRYVRSLNRVANSKKI